MGYESEDTDGWVINIEANRKKRSGKHRLCMWGMRSRCGVDSRRWRSGESVPRWDGEGNPCTRKDKKGIKWI